MVGSPRGAIQSNDGRPRSRVLLVRILAGAVLVPLVLVINYRGGLVFAVFACILAGLGGREFYRICSRGATKPSHLAGVAACIAVCFSFYSGSLETAGLVMTVSLIVVLLERLARQDTEEYARAAALTFLGVAYIGWLMGFFILLRNAVGLSGAGAGHGRADGQSYVLLVLILTWSYDTMAYFGGSFLGRHRLFNRISPAKTVEGTLIGLTAAAVAAVVCRFAFAGYLGGAEAVMVGLMVGAVAQAGDLVESIVKRSTNTKDSSHLIPGHGGILDRFDSLLFTGPVFYLYLRAVAGWTVR